MFCPNLDINIQTVTAYIRQLADYRFGTSGQPAKKDRPNLSEWSMKDALMIWHAYRYGVPNVSPGAQGFTSLAAFQDRQNLTLTEGDSNITGSGAEESIAGAIPGFNFYFGQH